MSVKVLKRGIPPSHIASEPNSSINLSFASSLLVIAEPAVAPSPFAQSLIASGTIDCEFPKVENIFPIIAIL